MTFRKHTTKTSQFGAAASRTLGGQVGRVVREERRPSVAQPAQPVVATGALPGMIAPRGKIARAAWRGSGS